MSTYGRLSYIYCVVALFASSAALAETCKPDEAWSHRHDSAESNTETLDIKGSRATRIEICREKLESGATLGLTVQFEHQREATALAQGACLNKLSRWAIVRSKGTQNADGSPAEAKGVYRLCKE